MSESDSPAPYIPPGFATQVIHAWDDKAEVRKLALEQVVDLPGYRGNERATKEINRLLDNSGSPTSFLYSFFVFFGELPTNKRPPVEGGYITRPDGSIIK